MKRAMLALLLTGSVAVLGACGGDSTGPSLNCQGGTPIAVGATVNGVLQEGDALDFDGAWLDPYALAVTTSGQYTITMRSTALDSFLWLIDGDGDVIDADDDAGGNLDARITRTLARGCYVIEATTNVDETGAYTLTVQRS